jgi:hypothetical protein
MPAKVLKFKPQAFWIKNIYHEMKPVDGKVLAETGLGYWHYEDLDQYRPTIINCGVGVGAYRTAAECEEVCRDLAALPVDWNKVTLENYKEIISGDVRKEYLEITSRAVRGSDI